MRHAGISWSLRLALGWLLLAATIGTAAAEPTPPRQPADGPGGGAYAHAAVAAREAAGGAQGWWLFLPAQPTPATAPVVVFCHGWGGMDPTHYRAWIDHIVRRGSIVIYPLYQDSLRTPAADFLPNATAAVRAALDELGTRKDGIAPDLARLAAVGHSAGGMLAAGLGATAAASGLPPFRAVMSVEPGDGLRLGDSRIPPVDFGAMPAETLLLVLVGAEDERVGREDGARIHDGASAVPDANKDLLEMQSDDHGAPALIANHSAPSATLDRSGQPLAAEDGRQVGARAHRGAVDALDWYGTWRLFDALTAAAFHGRNRDMALGGTAAQLSMGTWSDGTPVKPLVPLR
jgi:dienelactone hydrolase